MVNFFKFLFIFQLLLLQVYANSQLKSEYFIKGKRVQLSDIIPNAQGDITLYIIENSRHSKRVKSSQLIQKLHSYGYKDFSSKHAYIQFSQQSPINTKEIKEKIRTYYKEHYKNISIEKIDLKPNRYINSLPNEYSIGLSRNAYLSRKSVLYIKTPQNKKIFFNYNIHAHINAYETKKEIKKGEELSFINCKKKSIMLEKFRAMPILELPKGQYEAKHRLKKSTLLTKRDITNLYLIKRGSQVNVTLEDGGVTITFSGRAIENGRYGDTIAIREKNNKKIYVIVTGKNRAKVK